MRIDLRQACFSLVGRRNSGKTQLLKHIVRSQGHLFKEIFLVSPSSFSGSWKGILPEENIHESYNEDWMLKLFQKMTNVNKGKTVDDPKFIRILVILDDVVSSETKAHHSKSLATVFSRGRHAGMCMGLTAQWLTSISPLMRLNSDYLFIGKTNAASVAILFDEFNLGDMNEKEFQAFVRKNTDDYRFLVICNCANNTSDLKQVYGSIKAPPPK